MERKNIIVIYGVRIKEFQSGHRFRKVYIESPGFPPRGAARVDLHETYETLLFEWQDIRFLCRKGIPSHDRSHKAHPKVVFLFEQTATPWAVLQTGGFPCCCKQSSGVLQKLRNWRCCWLCHTSCLTWASSGPVLLSPHSPQARKGLLTQGMAFCTSWSFSYPHGSFKLLQNARITFTVILHTGTKKNCMQDNLRGEKRKPARTPKCWQFMPTTSGKSNSDCAGIA